MKSRLFLFSLLTLFLFYCKGQEPVFTLLHTNDTHSQIDPFDTKTDNNVGGYLRRYEVIQEYRDLHPVLLVDAGDFSQGTPYFNFFNGFAEIKMMNQMGYEAVTLGNHEFDNGTKALGKRLKKAKFEVVCANYTFKDKKLQAIVKPYTIIYKNGLKIGIFGLTIDLNGLVSPGISEEVIYNNAIDVASKLVPKLRNEEHCDMIICLSHLGLRQESLFNTVTDSTLALAVGDIDIIVGGHTHEHLPDPLVINNVVILQLDYGGTRIGKLDIYKKDNEE